MSKSVNPLRTIAEKPFAVDAGSTSLVANGIYSVDDIIKPLLTETGPAADPRLFVRVGAHKNAIKWRKVSRQGWISPKAKARDDKDTILQIKFSQPKRLNFVSFELLRVPQVYSVKYYDAQRQKMVLLTDLDGEKVKGELTGFRINVLEPKKQKNNSHKWRRFDFEVPKVRTTLIEIHLNREIVGLENLEDFFELPRDTPYSVGIRNLRVKYKVRDDDDDDDDGTPTPIGTNERPFFVRHTSTLAHDDTERSYWECGPQGAANSIVPFFIDMRATDGTASIFDTLKLKPLWPGPSMSVYWSNDDVTTPWVVSPNRRVFTSSGTDAPEFTKNQGLVVDAIDGVWSMSNDVVRIDTSLDFVMGMQFTPTFTNSSVARFLCEFEDPSGEKLALAFDPTAQTASTVTGTFEIRRNLSTTLYTGTSMVLDIDHTYGVVMGYNHNDSDSRNPRGWYIATSTSTAATDIAISTGAGTVPISTFPETIRVGNDETEARPIRGYISKYWLRQDSFNDQVARTYLQNPDTFIKGEGDEAQRVNGFYKAVIVAPLTKDTVARVGPGAGYFRGKEWTPVPVDYTLSTSQYKLPVTQAKFLKLEFTNLVPRIYLTEEHDLPVQTFPTWVTNWYRATAQTNTGLPYTSVNNRSLFEARARVSVPQNTKRMPQLRSALEGASTQGLPPTIFHSDQSTADYAINPNNFDGSLKYSELQYATEPQRFFRTSRHDYEQTFITVQHRAFFCGIKELEVLRSDYTVMMDNPEYSDTFMDEEFIATNSDFINVGSSFQAQVAGAQLVSKTFQSFSKFQTAQIAVQDQGWESPLTDAQINLGALTHLEDLDGVALTSSTATAYSVVTGQYLGARGGNVIQVSRGDANEDDEYGVSMAVVNGVITATGARTSAAIRMQLPETNNGTYELRIYANDGGGEFLAASMPIVMPTKTWKEIEVVYLTQASEGDWRPAIVQTSPSIDEPLVVDMIGLWQNSMKWEFSNDGGATYTNAAWPLSNPSGYFQFTDDDNELKIRITALKENAIAGGWTVVPWYLDSSMVVRAPIDYNPPWGVSDSEDLRSTGRKPVFQIWSHFFPQRFSVNLRGLPLPNSL